MRALTVLRALTGAVVVVAAALGQLRWGTPAVIVAATLAYLLAATLVGVTHERRRRRGLPVFGILLIADGLLIQAVTFADGGMASPLRYLVLLQVVVVALVASYRTGLKVAIWQSLLLLTTHQAVGVGLLPATADGGAESPDAFVAVIWAVVIATCTASSMNERELRRRRFEVEALAVMARELEQAVTPAAVAATVCAATCETVDARRAVVIDLREAPAVLAGVGTITAPPARTSPDALLARLRHQRRALLVTGIDPDTNPWLAALLPDADHVVLLPLTVQGEVVGALVLERPMRPGSRLEQRVLDAALRIADHAAVSLSNAWLRHRLAQFASTDGLTGLANRRTLDEALLDGHRPRALVLLDLDHFKAVNDTHGHAAGDTVLRTVGEVLLANVPEGALAARFGGEELAVLLPDAGADEAGVLAEAIRIAVATSATPVPVTASLGVAADDATTNLDATGLVEQTDAALYEAKRRGRDRVVVAGRGRPHVPPVLAPAGELRS
jgi:two-component system, cell cycle response regulator